jgi:hypothetical protein
MNYQKTGCRYCKNKKRFEDFLRKSSLPQGSDEPLGEFEEL